MSGSENNDSFFADGSGNIKKITNNSGGVLGEISDGSPLIFRAAFKPTPSIGAMQKTSDSSGRNREIEITGRHDPVIVPRAVIVVEAMAAITVADLLMQNMFSKIENINKIYQA